jgi:hypothetical protein
MSARQTVNVLLKSGRRITLDLEEQTDLVPMHDYWGEYFRGFVKSALFVGRLPRTNELLFIPVENIEFIGVEKGPT